MEGGSLRSNMKRLCLAYFLLLLAIPAFGQDFDKGFEAYAGGDYVVALKEFRPLAELGYPASQFYVGVMYDYGEGVPQDNAEAAYWYHLAAEQGDADAQFNLGLSYYKGEGVPQDYVQAAAWYRRAAEQGDADAQFNLAIMHEDGQGVP